MGLSYEHCDSDFLAVWYKQSFDWLIDYIFGWYWIIWVILDWLYIWVILVDYILGWYWIYWLYIWVILGEVIIYHFTGICYSSKHQVFHNNCNMNLGKGKIDIVILILGLLRGKVVFPVFFEFHSSRKQRKRNRKYKLLQLCLTNLFNNYDSINILMMGLLRKITNAFEHCWTWKEYQVDCSEFKCILAMVTG